MSKFEKKIWEFDDIVQPDDANRWEAGIADAVEGLNDHVKDTNNPHPNATSTINGFMSSADKIRLDGIPLRAAIQVTDWDALDPRTLGLRRGEVIVVWSEGVATAPWMTTNTVSGTITRTNPTASFQLELRRSTTGAENDSTEVVAIRQHGTSGWGRWRILIDSQHTHTAVQIGALPVTGGTLTGTLNARQINSGNLRLNNANTLENLVDTLNLNGGFQLANHSTSGAAVLLRNHGSHGGDLRIGQDSTGQRIWSMMIHNRTTASAANVHVSSAGTLFRSTSASKYKLDIQRTNDVYLSEKILDLKIASWFDKPAVETYANFLTRRFNNKDVNIDNEDIPFLRRHYGLIAEDVDDIGLGMYVTRGADGSEIEGIEYERLWTLLIPLVREQRDNIARQNKEIKMLKERVERLEQKEIASNDLVSFVYGNLNKRIKKKFAEFVKQKREEQGEANE